MPIRYTPVTSSPGTADTAPRSIWRVLACWVPHLSIATLLRRSGIARPRNAAHRLGRRGEALAARYLRQQRYKVLCRNFRPRHGGEIDLICRDRTCNTLVFVEVKTRSSDAWQSPADAVNREKRKLLARGARQWLRMLENRDVLFRFDVVEVIDNGTSEPRINLIRNAFTMG